MEYLIAWAAFGAAAATVAKDKNRNIIIWIVLGLLFGPFALLSIAMMKPGPGPDQGYS